MIFILGDVHGEFKILNMFINKIVRNDRILSGIASIYIEEGSDFQVIILQCGDFAFFWPFENQKNEIINRIDWLPGGYVPVYWTGGNHEDWDELDKLGFDISEVDRGIYYCPFGSTLEIKPDLTILFAGGAESSDKEWRLEAMTKGAPKIWGNRKAYQKRYGKACPGAQADWVISHTAPNAFDLVAHMNGLWNFDKHLFEPRRGMLKEVLVKYHPKRWLFGYFHKFMQGMIDGCKWECLANLGSGSKSWDKGRLEWED